MSKTVLHIGSDHRGFPLKDFLLNLGGSEPLAEFIDHGPSAADRVDYPDFANKVCQAVLENPSHRGLLICGSGQGMAMRANKFSGIRAALCSEKEICELSRQHNNSNVLCLGADFLSQEQAVEIVKTFLQTEFEGGRHTRRVEMISETTA